MNHLQFVRDYRLRNPSSSIGRSLFDQQVVLGDFYFWRGCSSDGTRRITVLQSKAWITCERYLDELMHLQEVSFHNRCAHPAWADTYAAAHSADIWQYCADGESVFVEHLPVSSTSIQDTGDSGIALSSY